MVDPVSGTKEGAFVDALSAAGVSHAVTRACRAGSLLHRCGCDASLRGRPAHGDGVGDGATSGQFQWSGCSDNVAYGNAFSKAFVDARERSPTASTASSAAAVPMTGSGRKATARTFARLHNNQVGRKVDNIVYITVVIRPSVRPFVRPSVRSPDRSSVRHPSVVKEWPRKGRRVTREWSRGCQGGVEERSWSRS